MDSCSYLVSQYLRDNSLKVTSFFSFIYFRKAFPCYHISYNLKVASGLFAVSWSPLPVYYIYLYYTSLPV